MITAWFASPTKLLLAPSFSGTYRLLCTAILCSLIAASGRIASGQVITVDTKTGTVSTGASTVDRRYAPIKPTNVELSKTALDTKTRLELIRVLQSEQGFAMRPFPRGHKGLTLMANGNLKPVGEGYLDMVTQFGMCAKPGDAVELTDVKFDRDKIEFQINGGPDLKHRFLRHIEIGGAGGMSPAIQDAGDGSDQPTGARITLEFEGGVPQLTGSQVKALLSPLISFDVKTPAQAFTDTLPPKLKEAILNHDVWVGMSTDMVLFAKGAPARKIREVDGQIPFEEWIYGDPPKPVEFVRINGNRVIRVEIAKVGEPPEIFTKDEVEGLMRTDGTPIIAPEQPHVHTVQVGDVERDPDKQAAAPPPTLTKPGEQLPDRAKNSAGDMKPVQFPKQKSDDYPDASKLPRDQKPSDNPDDDGNAAGQPDGSKTGQANPQQQPASPPPSTPPDPLDAPKPQ